MTPLADLTLRAAVVVLAGLAGTGLLRRRSAALRHAVLAGSIFAAALTAPLSLILPPWHLTGPALLVPASSPGPGLPSPAAAPAGGGASPAARPGPHAPARAPRPVSGTQMLAAVWAAGVLLGAARMLGGLHRLRLMSRAGAAADDDRWARPAAEISTACGLRRRVQICHTDAPDRLGTFGLWPPRILLPAQARRWSDERIRIVLLHEFAHIVRRDWLVLLAADLVRIVYWFNPLFWMASARLRRDSEQACDDAVLRKGIQARVYAAHLLDLARVCRRHDLASAVTTAMARPSTLERRVSAMLDSTIDRAPLSARALRITLGLLAVATLPIAALGAGQSAPLPLSGSVYDATGGVLPAVELTVEDAGQQKWQVSTDSSGHFSFPELAPGRYVLTASLPGFRPLRDDFTLRYARDWDRAITLQVGAVRESIAVRSARAAAQPAPSGAPGPQPIRVGGNVRAPRKLLDVKPIYPPSMREAGREGVVPIDAVIGRDGAVHAVRVLSANIHPDFAVAAADAVRQWRFDPTLLNGEPVDVAMTVTITFSLSE